MSLIRSPSMFNRAITKTMSDLKKLLVKQRSYSVYSDDQDLELLDHDQQVHDESKIDSTHSFLKKYSHLLPSNDSTSTDQIKRLNHQIKWKLFKHLIPLVMTINAIMFIDKSVLSYGILLGLFESTGITEFEYNNLNSWFYLGYLLGQIPLNFLLQKFNFARSIRLILIIWFFLILLTGFAVSYHQLLILRFSLGFFESVVMPALEITLHQFFTPRERSMINPLFWISCTGPSVWVSGIISNILLKLPKDSVFLNYGDLEIAPWRIFMFIIGIMTLSVAIWSYFKYPANPTEAEYLTLEERVFLIDKVSRESNSVIEQKTVKTHHIRECLRDPVTWLFVALGFTSMIHNNVGFQSNILYHDLGVSNLNITLINIFGGFFSSAYLILGIYIIYKVKESSLISILFSGIPGLIGAVGMVAIPYENKKLLAINLFITNHTFALAFIVIVGWNISSVTGYTKKFYRNILFMFGYSIANIISPQIWKIGHQAPRYLLAWSIQIVVSYFLPLVIAVFIHVTLKRRNIERLEYIERNPEALYGRIVTKDLSTGEDVIETVDIGKLDLTDLENKTFIYPL